jgi:CheY-like chemotaxis protein
MNKSDQTGLKILLVDDDPSVLDSIERVLNYLGHAVQTADSGAAALEVVAKGAVDLVITDYFMPDMKGDELARRLKQRQPGQRILMVTAYADEFKADGRYKGLVEQLLIKPFNIAQLKECVDQVMR